MGIKGLNRIIKKLAPGIIREVPITKYVGTKIAIDSSILLYRYRYQAQDTQNSHVFGFFQRACYYLRRGILPVFVFDGTPPAEKQCVIEKRSNHKLRIQEKINELRALPITETHSLGPTTSREYSTVSSQEEIEEKIEKLGKQIIYVTRQHKNECRYLLRLLGIPTIDSEGEAEATCAELQKRQIVSATYTEDSDALTFGSPIILRSAKKLDTVIEISLGEILKEFNMTYPQFVDFCILCGCDYAPSIPKIGPMTAMSLIAEHKNLETILNTLPDRYKVPDDFDYVRARELFHRTQEVPSDIPVLNEPSLGELEIFLTKEIGVPKEEYEGLLGKYKHSVGSYRKTMGPKCASIGWQLLL